jgi:hypothetical protein
VRVIISSRFRGPPTSANGGYACGVVANLLGDGDIESTLRLPPPVDRELTGEVREGRAVLLDGETVVAEAVPTTLGLEVPAPVSFDDAQRATQSYPWRTGHPLPGCFVCGSDRHPGDGLCLYPGAVEGRNVAAAPWIPDATVVDADGLVTREIVWAALDCPSWFGMHCFHPWTEGMALLGRLAARINSRPRLGETCVAGGWFLRRDGRKMTCGSVIYGQDGTVHAFARAIWVQLKS